MEFKQQWSRKALAVFISAMAAQSGSVFANGKSDSNVQALETLQVLGVEEDGFNVAITAEMIEKRQASDLEDLLRHEPSITVGGGLPVAQKVYVRGIEDTLMNVTIDGATQAGYLYHHQGRISVEPELIKEIVVKAGAGNATDGAGALGGAIHFKLKDAKDMLRDGETSGALVKVGFFSNNDAIKKHGTVYSMLTDDFGLMASFTRLDGQDNYEDGAGNEVENSRVSQDSVRLKLSGKISDEAYLGISLEDYIDEGIRFARPNMIGLFHPVYPSSAIRQETKRESVTVNLGYSPASNLVDVEYAMYYTDNYLTKQGDEFIASWPPTPPFASADYHNGEEHGGGVETRGFDLRNTALFGDNEIIVGAEYREDKGYLINQAVSNFDKEETKIKAIYAQAEIGLTRDFRLSTGIRYDDYDYTDNYGEEINDEGVSPNLTVTFDVNDEIELHASYAEAFKGVSIPEVWFLEFPPLDMTMSNYQGASFEDDGFMLGKVQAEESSNIELGFKYEGVDFAASGEIFKQTIEHAQVTSPTVRYSYVDDVEVEGYALRAAYYLENISINAGVSESVPELDGEPLSSSDMGLGTAYGRTWTTGLQYRHDAYLTFGWNARYAERLSEVRDGQDEKAGYGIHDLHVQWIPVDDLTLGFAINNVLDKFFYDQGTFYSSDDTTAPYGLPEPGRDFRVSLAYQF